ncbi:MAG: molybdopterin-dependent oxidoreductase [Chlorobi bacterium]|nr:molybdopterin-dependent oxidoreductase [Chlorobiota bacterium]
MKTTRRDFIKISSLGIGGLALSTSPILGWVPSFLKEDDNTPDDSTAKRYPNYCEVCFWNCAGWVYTNKDKDGNEKIWKIIGNDDDPNSNGRFCPRGTGGIGMYYDKDRLRKPLKRVTGEDGNQTFVEIEWDEAIDIVAKKMKEIKTKYGPESFALFKHGTSGKHFATLFKAYGSKNMAGPAYSQCKAPREEGFRMTFGHPLHSPEPLDIRNTRCLVLIGSHLGENMHNGQVQEMSEAIENGASIITVDPRFSTAASKSKFWLPIKPSTDIALLLAWMHVIIKEKRYDIDYVEKNTSGFEQLKNHVKNFTPEWAYGITTIKPDIIRKTAREMAAASPAVIIHPGRHATWYGDDTQRSRAIAILNALLGSWGRRGGFFNPEKAKLPKYPMPAFPKPKWSWRDIAPDKYPLAKMGVTNLLIDGSHPDKKEGHKIKAWFVVGTNLPVTIPNSKRTIEAIHNQEFIVVVDTMPSEMAGYADIVLPEATYLERYDDLRLAQHREPTIALRMPAAKPYAETRPGWKMCKDIAGKLGLSEYFNYNDYSEVLDWQLKKIGSSLDEMKEIGVMKLDRKYNDLYFHEHMEHEFETPTGKIEFYSNGMLAAGFAPMPVYTKHPEPPKGFYRLIYGRAPMHTFSRTTNNPYLMELMKENALWVNPKTAKDWGLKTGQRVWLQNHQGAVSTFSIAVRVTERIRQDSVYMVHGFGRLNKKLTKGYGAGISDTEMVTDVKIDKETGSTGMRSNFVTFLTEEPEKKEKTV